ncbi:MAG: methyltransferase domain-containing protein [Desulfovibrio sp.]|nr:methyltransferase domain-containing protein [Desulfovibrio sp.]
MRTGKAEAFRCIDVRALPRFEPGQRVMLFGAGNGSRELLRYFAELENAPRVLGVLDNNPTLQGRDFLGLTVYSPQDLERFRPELVIVTTVSGREAVSAQLSNKGLRLGRDFVLVGTFPSGRAVQNLRELLMLLSKHGREPGRSFLHVGPGGFLGLECGLLALFGQEGPEQALAVDAYDFSMRWPDVTDAWTEYTRAREDLLALAAELGLDRTAVARRWDGLFHAREERMLLDGDRVRLLFPHRFSNLPAADASQDLVCSFAVLEHVRSPKKAVQEIWRVLAPGGTSVMAVTTRDHRSFGPAGGYTPISYRTHSAGEWEAVTADTFYQNRVAPFQWRDLFAQQGFDLLEYRVLHEYAASRRELETLHPEFRAWPEHRQREVDCIIVAARPGR